LYVKTVSSIYIVIILEQCFLNTEEDEASCFNMSDYWLPINFGIKNGIPDMGNFKLFCYIFVVP